MLSKGRQRTRYHLTLSWPSFSNLRTNLYISSFGVAWVRGKEWARAYQLWYCLTQYIGLLVLFNLHLLNYKIVWDIIQTTVTEISLHFLVVFDYYHRSLRCANLSHEFVSIIFCGNLGTSVKHRILLTYLLKRTPLNQKQLIGNKNHLFFFCTYY